MDGSICADLYTMEHLLHVGENAVKHNNRGGIMSRLNQMCCSRLGENCFLWLDVTLKSVQQVATCSILAEAGDGRVKTIFFFYA